eukprot:CAMPEP_0175606162 /NCGR_PEP_ID=MMETSP0096-20121207/60578_1 /TAXON_ID=311494 /ORGANISM="Alexandrium monilatum, Strain CCMP3105" /LENGTH=63 /DNA_ID=CAMNT_0016910993 /DNA_START=104 /DNA_END=292 /DNA_ORIENTATION=-
MARPSKASGPSPSAQHPSKANLYLRLLVKVELVRAILPPAHCNRAPHKAAGKCGTPPPPAART